MRTITKKELNNINGAVGTPPGGAAFGSLLLLMGSYFFLTSNNTSPSNTSVVTNVSCYLNNWFNLSGK